MKNQITIALASIFFLAVSCKEEEIHPPITKVVNIRDTVKIAFDTVFLNDSSVVLYSDWLSPTSTSGTGTGTGSGPGTGTGTPSTPSMVRSCTFNAPYITQKIIDKGVILAYCKLDGDAMTRALATTTMVNGFISIWDYAVSVGKIQFIQTTGNPAGIPAISSKHQFRYVVIPPSRNIRLSKPYSLMSYDEICQLFNIPK
ncbi:MAG: hypothetical protein IT275_09160 [Chitinophagales bacterium]|nr:hypothetical protein [Chitinophagales bacterium]